MLMYHVNLYSALHGSFIPAVSGGDSLGPGSVFENKNKVIENVTESLCSWGNSQNQQVTKPFSNFCLTSAVNCGYLFVNV